MSFTAFRAAAVVSFVAIVVIAGRPVAGQPAVGDAAAAKPKDAAEELTLEASDGVEVKAWYYPVKKEAEALGSVILIHDLGGSHLTVEPLARILQATGYAVVAPDLRGHGETKLLTAPSQVEDQSKVLKKLDFEMMAATRGGQKRDQSGIRGDIECVRNWLKQQADEGALVMKPLFVVGAGVGAAVAATWTAADAMWPDIATGPQGRDVTGLVLVSPVFTARGFSIAPALASEAVRHSVPLQVIVGNADRDGTKVFDQLKRQRPKLWYDNRHPNGEGKDASPATPAEARLLLFAVESDQAGDALASQRSADPRRRGGDPSGLITVFLKEAAKTR